MKAQPVGKNYCPHVEVICMCMKWAIVLKMTQMMMWLTFARARATVRR